MVMYDYDINTILYEPITNRHTETIRYAFLNMYEILKSRVKDLQVCIINNKCSSDLKETIKKYTIDFQLSPPHMHWKNASEQDIRTCKNYFILGFSTTDPGSPIRKWDQLFSQSLITLNPIHNSRVNPALSAHAYLYGPYGFKDFPWSSLELMWYSKTNLVIARRGVIMAPHIGILVHHLIITYACSVK